jgi:hypothetical protein
MQRILFMCLFSIITFGSCEYTKTKRYSSIEDYKFKKELGEVLQRASQRLEESECIVFRMDTLTKFDWDKMYAIGGNVFQEQIGETIGIPWEYDGGVGIFSEGDLLLVFIKRNKIVSTVRYIEGDPIFENFLIGTLGDYTSKSNSFYYMYKQYFSKMPGFYLKVNPIHKDSLLKHKKTIDGLKIVSIDNE